MKTKLFTLFLAIMATNSLWAYDFQVNGIYYNYLDGNNVEVTNQKYQYYSGEVTIPETVTYFGTTYRVTGIGENAFYGCSSLTSITIPSSVTSIGNMAFSSCPSLTSMVVEAGNYDSRENCNAIIETATNTLIAGCKNTTIPNSVTSIGKGAFRGCSSLTSITIPNSVTSIGDLAFNGCSSLTSITIPKNVTSIGDYTFQSCTALASITIPNSVTGIGKGAFYACSSLTSITIPKSVTSIGEGAFYDCSSLASIIIPNSVTSIGTYVFYGCSSLTSVSLTGSSIESFCQSITNKLLINTGLSCSRKIILNDHEITELVISEVVKSIESYAFYGCSSLVSITIPNSVTGIGKGAFCACSSLTSITIPKSVTNIGEGAFSDCSSLASITIPNSVTSIGDHTFYGCSSLTSVTIPNSVTSIGSYAFYGCSFLTSITIGNSVTSIGDHAFNGCSSLTSITIPNSVMSVGMHAFKGCSKLTSISLGNSLTSIGSYAFYGCTSLTSITIPKSVTSIGKGTFYGCSSLTSMVVEAGNYDSRENCNAIIETATNTLIAGCKNTTIPKSVTSIRHEAFYGCSSLTSITIPNSVTSIGDHAFNGCSSLTSITSEATTPPNIGGSTFHGVSTSIPLYVPCLSISAYKSASGWGVFTNIQEPLVEYSIQVSTSNSQMGSAQVDYNTFCDGSQISAIAYDRYHFVQWSDGVTDNPRTLTLTQDTVLTAEFAITLNGPCGDNLYWAYDQANKTISITGSGNMYNYTTETQPWLLLKEEIKEVSISNIATSIGTSAFEGCIRLGKVNIGAAIENVGANAFAGCTRLYDIHCYATYPPFAELSSFANYNVYLYVPYQNQRDYMLDIVWGKFKFIECIGAEDVENTDDVTINAGLTDVTITWPTEEGADTYTIVIKKGNEIFCTLTFNAEGHLLNIAFAPGRNGNHPAQYAEQTTNGGFRFTVTGLEEGTNYTYDITTIDDSDNTISTHSGSFTTQSNTPTIVENIYNQLPIINCQKIIRDNQLLIIRDGKIYSVMGHEL